MKPPSREEILSAFGRLGGSAKSEAKTAAARRNARKGGWPKGRPRKHPSSPPTPLRVSASPRENP